MWLEILFYVHMENLTWVPASLRGDLEAGAQHRHSQQEPRTSAAAGLGPGRELPPLHLGALLPQGMASAKPLLELLSLKKGVLSAQTELGAKGRSFCKGAFGPSCASDPDTATKGARKGWSKKQVKWKKITQASPRPSGFKNQAVCLPCHS